MRQPFASSCYLLYIERMTKFWRFSPEYLKKYSVFVKKFRIFYKYSEGLLLLRTKLKTFVDIAIG